jgi:hypothetical protein
MESVLKSEQTGLYHKPHNRKSIMNDKHDHVVQRTRQYWFNDGLVELSTGGIFLFLGLYFFIQSLLPSGSILLFVLQSGFILAIIGSIFLGRRVVNKYKSRLTFPRTGYVSYKQPSVTQRLISAGLALLMSAIILGLVLSTTISMNWIPAITGLIVSTVWLISAARVGLTRFYLQSILSMILGVGLSLVNLETYQSLALYYALMGILLVLSGALTLAKYLRQYPPLENDSPA